MITVEEFLKVAAPSALFGAALGACATHFFTKQRAKADRKRAFRDSLNKVIVGLQTQKSGVEAIGFHVRSIEGVRAGVAEVLEDIKTSQRVPLCNALDRYCQLTDDDFAPSFGQNPIEKPAELFSQYADDGKTKAVGLLREMSDCSL